MRGTDEDGWNYAESHSRFGRLQIACGVIRHPVTQNYQLWISLYGHDVTCIFSHKDKEICELIRMQFQEKWQNAEMMTTHDVVNFGREINLTPGSEPVDPLPEQCLLEIRGLINQMAKLKRKAKGFG